MLSFKPPPCIKFEENINNWFSFGFGLINFIWGLVLTMIGTENLTPLKSVFKSVLSILDSLIVWLKGKTGKEDFLFDPAMGI